MNISFIDIASIHPSSLDLEELNACGKLTYYDKLDTKEIVKKCGEEEILIVNKIQISEEILSQLPRLKQIIASSTGVNQIDIVATKKRGIIVSNVPSYSKECVSQHAISLLLALANNFHKFSREVAQKWPNSDSFTYFDYPVIELKNKKLGIVGMGEIGQAMSKIATALGMEVYALEMQRKHRDLSVPRFPEKEFFSSSDFISLHCPLTKETENLINERTLSLMKSSAFLINTARGGLIDEAALSNALKEKKIAGAGLDVLKEEPPSKNHPLLENSSLNLIITPHTAWIGKETRQRLLNTIVENIRSFQKGSPINCV